VDQHKLNIFADELKRCGNRFGASDSTCNNGYFATEKILKFSFETSGGSDDDLISADGRGSANRGGGMGGGRGGRSGSPDDRASSSSQSYEPLPAAYGKLKPSDFIKAFVMPADRLEIRLSNDQIVLQQDSRVRTLLAGDEQPYSVSDRYGSRAVTAGFSGQKLMVLSQDKQRLSVQESFEINSQGLLETIKFEARGLKSITAHFWYRRAKAEDQVIPNEGPPQPGAR